MTRRACWREPRVAGHTVSTVRNQRTDEKPVWATKTQGLFLVTCFFQQHQLEVRYSSERAYGKQCASRPQQLDRICIYKCFVFICYLVSATFQNPLTLESPLDFTHAHHCLWLNVALLLPLQSVCFCFLSFHSSYSSPSRPLANEEWLLVSLLR